MSAERAILALNAGSSSLKFALFEIGAPLALTAICFSNSTPAASPRGWTIWVARLRIYLVTDRPYSSNAHRSRSISLRRTTS